MKIPLFTPTDVPGGWHQVIAPGGYEWWHFDAEDTGGGLRLVADFFQGLVFDAGYLRTYRRYRRWPTRCVPPLPAAYPAVSFAIYDRDKLAAGFDARYAATDFAAASDRLDVRIGPSSATAFADGIVRLQLQTETISAELKFVPRFRRVGAAISTPPLFFADQSWSIVEPLCEVSGDIAASGRRFNFTGPGYHDQQFGTMPPGLVFSHWMTGRVLSGDHSLIFHYAQLTTGAANFHLYETDPLGTRAMADGQIRADWDCRAAGRLRYPDHLEAGQLCLHSPKVLESSSSSIALAYTASVRGVEATAFCEIVPL